MNMKYVVKFVAPSMPFVIIAGLLYASFFIKPKQDTRVLQTPIFERGDRFYGLAVPEDHVIWMVGSGGKIFRSEDNAKSWVLQVSGVQVALQDIAAWDRQRAIAVGNDHTIILTSDGGSSWRPVDIPNRHLANKWLRVRALSNGGAWVLGEGGSLLRSTDFGGTWEHVGKEEDVAWNDIQFRGNLGWLVGEFGRIRASVDGGASWFDALSPVKMSLMGVAFRDPDNGIAVGLGGVVLSSQDGGKTWTQKQSLSQEHLFSVVWDGDWWVAVGDKGLVVIITPDGAVRNAQVALDDRSWYTTILNRGEHYFLAGARFAMVDKNIGASKDVRLATRGAQ